MAMQRFKFLLRLLPVQPGATGRVLNTNSAWEKCFHSSETTPLNPQDDKMGSEQNIALISQIYLLHACLLE